MRSVDISTRLPPISGAGPHRSPLPSFSSYPFPSSFCPRKRYGATVASSVTPYVKEPIQTKKLGHLELGALTHGEGRLPALRLLVGRHPAPLAAAVLGVVVVRPPPRARCTRRPGSWTSRGCSPAPTLVPGRPSTAGTGRTGRLGAGRGRSRIRYRSLRPK
jgi:hypothetical protein